MSIPASPKAEPPDAPLVVACLPELLTPTKIFSTLIADNAEHPIHVASKTPLAIIAGFQLANTSAEKSIRELQKRQEAPKFSAFRRGVSKLPSEEHDCHAYGPTLIKGNVVSKFVSAEQLIHVWLKFTTRGKSAEKLVSAEQLWNADTRFIAVGNAVLNEVSPLACHALVKFTELVASVPSFASAGNC